MDASSAVESKSTLNPCVLAELDSFLNARFPGEKFTYALYRATAKGENYIGVVYRVKVDFQDGEEGAGGKGSFSLIVKVPPSNPIQRRQFFARPAFLRESLAYKEFLPLVEKFQTEKGLTEPSERFSEHGEVYRALDGEDSEAIFMEDLSVRGFQLFDRFKELDCEHVSFVMRTYAKLHAISFALKTQEPSRLRPFEQIEDIFEQRRNDERLTTYFEHLKGSALKSLDPQQDAKHYAVLTEYFSKTTFLNLMLHILKGVVHDQGKSYAVVCHGDCWNNNILYKYDEHGAVTDVKLIDWQVMRYTSPITDIIYYLFTCTTGAFRRRHFESMMNVYYAELSRHLERLQSRSAEVFPRAAFEKELRERGACGLLFAMIILPIVTLKSEDSPNLEEISERIEAGNTTDLQGAGFLGDNNTISYQQRMRDVIIDCIDFGFITAN